MPYRAIRERAQAIIENDESNPVVPLIRDLCLLLEADRDKLVPLSVNWQKEYEDLKVRYERLLEKV